MNINSEELKAVKEISMLIIEPIINVLIKPHIDKLNNWISKKNNEQKIIDNFWENKFSKYLERLYEESSYLTTLVFPNSRTKIKELYIPLTLQQPNSFEKINMESFDYSIFTKYKKILISDYAGMGKSTLLKWITISIIEQQKSIPILIELRKIDEKNSLIDEIFNQLNPIDKSFDKDLVYNLLDLGFFTILLDGFDEIAFDFQENIINQMSYFIRKTSSNNFILTSRQESSLSSFVEFQLFNIKPLEEEEAYNLIKKLDGLSKIKFGRKLIEEIEEKNSQVKEFLSNPFLVSLLYKSYTYNKDIPSKKITFYEEVYSCLFKHHDLSKEGFKRPKKSRLDIFDFEIILRDIAFETSKIGKVIYSKDELIKYIISAKSKNSRLDFKEINFLDDLTTTVPIFNIEGVKIKWAHKSIQDFFSAKYVSNHSKKEDIIGLIYNSGKYNYLNILDLLYDLEHKIFNKIITKTIIKDFIKFYKSQFKIKPEISQELINERVALVFGSKFCLIKTKTQISYEEAREIFASKIGVDVNNFRVGATFHQSEPPYCILNEQTLLKQIIKILRLKNEDLFFETNSKQSSIIDEHLKIFKFDTPYVIDDDINQPYNEPKIFERINNKLKFRLRDFREKGNITYNLDYKKCNIKLKQIEKEISKEDSIDLFSNI